MARATPLPPDERRQTIIDAARPLLVAGGGQFTTRQVAEAAGVAEGTIFRVFECKQDLMAAVIEDTLDPTELCLRIRGLAPQPSLAQHVARLVELLVADAGAVHAVASALHSAPGGLTASAHRGHDKAAHHQRAVAVSEALVDSLTPFADQIRVSLPQAAAVIRIMAMASGHPMLADLDFGDPAGIAEVIVHGVHTPQED
ncbi:MAG: TetR/AcrR family transcriptional regulator [Brooklawnia sp.]|uniref:TetR/AcrR family transcriptional regulator n=1 Tax=Brooklawnia sp. TaxID=2699740 RepID=UPI003C75157F